MQYEEFIQRVEDKIGPAQLDPGNPGQAKLAANATLTTLGERISGGEAKDLASQLPGELQGPLELKSEKENAENFSLEEFYQRVARREEADLAKASVHASAVVSTLGEALTGGELENIQTQLPNEFAPLFG